jgi:hypothetical protein
MVAVLIAAALCVSLGASVALAGRGTLADGPLFRQAGLWALVVLQALIFLPVTGYVLHRFGDWSVFYLFDSQSLGEPAAFAFFFPPAAIASFIGARRLLLKGKLYSVIGMVAGGVALAALVGWLGRESLLLVGSTAGAHKGIRLRPLTQTGLIYLLAGSGAFVLASWTATLWRLTLVSRAARRQALAQSRKSARRTTGGSSRPGRKRAERA